MTPAHRTWWAASARGTSSRAITRRGSRSPARPTPRSGPWSWATSSAPTRPAQSAVGNGSYGVLVYGSSANTIGGATGSPGTGLGNVISGNSQAGIQIYQPRRDAGQAIDNVVLGNLVGTNAGGTAGLGNGSDGIEIENASGNIIGGASTADRNVISGNAGNGVLIVQFPNLSASRQPDSRQLDRHQRRGLGGAGKPGQRRGADRRIGQLRRRHQRGSDNSQIPKCRRAADRAASPAT